jgi:hypothetical protein
MAKSALGQIPDSHFENEPSMFPKNKTPLSQAELEWIAAMKAEAEATKKPLA